MLLSDPANRNLAAGRTAKVGAELALAFEDALRMMAQRSVPEVC